MKISTKGRYGLRIMVDIAQNVSEVPRNIHDICKSQNLSEKYVSRLIIGFRRAGIIYSVRGAGGGYMLKRQPKHITLLEILEASEGKISIVDCVLCPKKCKKAENCVVREVWTELNNKIKKAFESVTLQDILDKGQNLIEYFL